MNDAMTPKVIADALKFLAAGFEMAADAGVPAVVRCTAGPAGSENTYYHEPRTCRATCNVEMLEVRAFSCRLPIAFLLGSIGARENTCVLEGEDARGAASFGGPPQDGSETYRLRRVELTYRETADQRFHLTARVELGEPIPSTFVYRGPKDIGAVYEAAMDVEFREIFKFICPTTKAHAEALIAKLDQEFGLRIDMPAFFVSK
jgi:hypothetical protein